MSMMEHVLPGKIQRALLWRWYLLDTLLAFAGSLLITGCIAIWQLYPCIPNISIVYLLVVLTLASTRGRYSATLESGDAVYALHSACTLGAYMPLRTGRKGRILPYGSPVLILATEPVEGYTCWVNCTRSEEGCVTHPKAKKKAYRLRSLRRHKGDARPNELPCR